MINKEKLLKVIDKSLPWLLAGIFISVPIAFAMFKENMNIFDLNKQLFFRFFLYAFVVLILVRCFLLQKIIIPKNFANLFLLFSFLSITISLLFSKDPLTSFLGLYERQQGVFSLYNYFLFSFALAIFIDSKEKVIQVLKIIVAGAILPTVYGLMQALNLDPEPWSGDQSRIFSAFGQPNFFAHYLIMVILPTAYFAWRSKKMSWRIANFLLLVGELICLNETASRGAFVGLSLSVLATVIIFGILQKNKKIIITVSMFIILGLGFIFLLRNNITTNCAEGKLPNKFCRLYWATDVNGGSSGIRMFYWRSAWQEFKESSLLNKFFGHGKDTQNIIFTKYYSIEQAVLEAINSTPDRAHNIVLDTLLEHGLFGLLSFGLLPIVALIVLLKKYKTFSKEERMIFLLLLSIILAYFGANSFSFSMTGYTVLYYGIIGLILGWGSQGRAEISLSKFTKYFQVTLLILITFIFIFCYYIFSWRYFVADRYYIKARTGIANRDCLMALDNIENVVGNYNWIAKYNEEYLLMYVNCLSLIGKQEKEVAYDNLLLGLKYMPEDQFNHYNNLTNVARAYTVLGLDTHNTQFLSMADGYYQKLITFGPEISAVYYDYGRMLLWSKQYNKAIDVLNKGLSVTPEVNAKYLSNDRVGGVKNIRSSMFLTLCQVYLEQNNFKNALNNCQKSIELNSNDALTHFSLAKIYKENNNKVKAIEEAKKAQKINVENRVEDKRVDTLLKELSK
ncbi:MAG: O-antigen ligase family protein [Patescibacteria group bacterium]|nr:O-antigen ligase family protein [Patescibacteria group bacterium]